MVIFLLSVKQAPYENFAEFVRNTGQKADISVRRDAETDTIVISVVRVTMPDNGIADSQFEQQSSTIRGISSVGRALAWHARGQGFNSPILHFDQKRALRRERRRAFLLSGLELRHPIDSSTARFPRFFAWRHNRP